jgi:hypothetical protein
MRVFVMNSALPRSPLARFAAGLAVLLVLAGLVLVVLPLAGLALLLLALAGAMLLALARGLWRLFGQPPAQGSVEPVAVRPRYETRRSQEVVDVEVITARRAPD